MALTIGRLALEDPEAFPESVGEAIQKIGATPVPGGRSGLSVSANLTSFPATGNTIASRERVRRQLRSMLNNLPMRLKGLYVNWTEDPEQNGWYVPGGATFDVAGAGSLSSAFWKFSGLDLQLIGRTRTHKRAVAVYLRDRRLSTTPRDTLKRNYSTVFSGLSPLAMTWMPSNAYDFIATTTTTKSGYGGSSLQAILGAVDLQVVPYEQLEANMNKGDVVIYDRRGTFTVPTSGPHADWEELYGPDYPLSESDVPVLDNSFCRVIHTTSSTPGFLIQYWTGSAWAEAGKVIIKRVGDSTGYLDTLSNAYVYEWSPERAILKVILRRAADSFSREEVYITLQRGWSGPRIEVYTSSRSGGTGAGSWIEFYRTESPSGTETANKFDASLVSVTGSPNFTPGTVGASTFTGDNYVLMRRSGLRCLILAVFQNGLTARVENNTSAYGSTRNGIAVGHNTSNYVNAFLGLNSNSDTLALENTTLYDGGKDLGRSILYDSRQNPTIVPR